MATWQKIVTEVSPDTISQNTQGTASGLNDGVILSKTQGGTGQDLSGTEGLLVTNESGNYESIKTDVTGQVLMKTANNTYEFATPPTITLEGDANVLTTDSNNVIFGGNVTVNGTLSANVVLYDFDVEATNENVVVLNNDGTAMTTATATALTTNLAGMLVDVDGSAGSGVTGLVYDATTNLEGFKAIVNDTKHDIALMAVMSSKPGNATNGENGVGSIALVKGTSSDDGLYIQTA